VAIGVDDGMVEADPDALRTLVTVGVHGWPPSGVRGDENE
jgi:hypothetical protein